MFSCDAFLVAAVFYYRTTVIKMRFTEFFNTLLSTLRPEVCIDSNSLRKFVPSLRRRSDFYVNTNILLYYFRTTLICIFLLNIFSRDSRLYYEEGVCPSIRPAVGRWIRYAFFQLAKKTPKTSKNEISDEGGRD